jgi:hypothetical protein
MQSIYIWDHRCVEQCFYLFSIYHWGNYAQCSRSAGTLAADAAAQAAGPPEACAAGDFFEASSR